MDRSFFVFFALTLCLLVLFFSPTVIAFIKFVHCYNHKRFFDAAELDTEEETKMDTKEIIRLIEDIVCEERRKEKPLRFYNYIHALDQNGEVEEYTKSNTKYRQYDYWLYHIVN